MPGIDDSGTEAILMIIQCPGCGFTGRIPDSALGGSHHATCPKCRHHFILRSSIDTSEPSGRRAFAPPVDAEVAGDDPGSSSYELRAMGGDDQQHDSDLPGRQRLTASKITDSSEPPVGTDSPAGMGPAAGPGVGDPWYSRLLQLWGLVLLIWATQILGRDLLRGNFSGDGPPGTGEILSTVIAVLLLVAGAAGLFVAVDFGRSLRTGVRPPATGPVPSKPAFSRTIGVRFRRFWHWPPRRGAQPIRS